MNYLYNFFLLANECGSAGVCRGGGRDKTCIVYNVSPVHSVMLQNIGRTSNLTDALITS